jgi:hypothetical protein
MRVFVEGVVAWIQQPPGVPGESMTPKPSSWFQLRTVPIVGDISRYCIITTDVYVPIFYSGDGVDPVDASATGVVQLVSSPVTKYNPSNRLGTTALPVLGSRMLGTYVSVMVAAGAQDPM